jgi:hypothetical protein
MAFVYKENKLKNVRPNTALGPGEYLPLTREKKYRNSTVSAPFDSSVKKFKSLYGELNAIKNATPGPGKYYTDELRMKTRKMENIAYIKRSNIDDFIPNKSQTNTNFFPTKEKLGFDIKVKRFKNVVNENPGPGEYFKGKKRKPIEEAKGTKGRARSALYFANNYVPKKNVLVPSIPYKDNGYEIGENNSLIKLESDKEIWQKNTNKIGPGSYDIDNPQSWLKNGSSWSKMKEERAMNINEQQNSKDVTRPETAIDLNIIAISSNKKNMKSKKNLNKNRFKAIRPNPAYYQMMKDSIDEENKLKVYHNQNGDGLPGPGQYIDIIKSSGFYKDTIPYPEFKQFFLSNNERFVEKKANNYLGPTTYYENNNYYKSSFSAEKILKKKDRNKIKKTPFNSREKRFNVLNKQLINEDNPGPGTYEPKIFKAIESNKFNNNTNTFNFRSKRFTTAGTDIKWKNSIPGPGSYINPYTAKGTSNTLLINGLYLDIRKGKDLLRPKSKITKSLKQNDNKIPEAGMFNPGLIYSIAYNNNKKVNSTNNNMNIAFNRTVKPEENKFNKTNLGPGYYYHPRIITQKQINPPFSQSDTKFKKNKEMYGIGPGYYESRSYFDWNKKSYNVSFN